MSANIIPVWYIFIIGFLLIQVLVYPIYAKASERTKISVFLYMFNLVNRKKALTDQERETANKRIVSVFFGIIVLSLVVTLAI